MIELEATRARLLAEIGAPGAGLEPLDDPGDPRFRSGEPVRLLASGSRRELFRRLAFALSARFADAPRAERIRDLLAPLRSALGNAHKHGNLRDRSRRIEVEVVATGSGALLAIRDEGGGFDARLAVERLRAGERYFREAGAGLRAFEAARSTVAWEAEGRTALIRFLAPSRGPSPEERALARALARELGGDPGSAVLEGGAPGEPPRLRCLLAGRDGAESRILCGRRLPSAARAAAELAATARLRERLPRAPLRVPRPLAPLRALPELALYDFDPWLDLEEYLAQRGAEAAASVAGRIGATLAALRRSGGDDAPAPAAARSGLGCVHYGVDGRFYLEPGDTALPSAGGIEALLERAERCVRARVGEHRPD